ncbi:DNA excision repair protein ERCC-6-like [Epinephelus moara]|uniref:DNA excision repair protein ERCC-6-like n=1 Tax=Epinephelus moara TaxID=300413 RepID=UPI00214EED5A|nr:DNA excision repair protein ERCC-6-like [Epinephelus moara]
MDVSQRHGGDAEISEKLEKSLSISTDDKMEAYHRFIQDGKDVARQGDIKKALKFFKLANDIHQSQKLESRIKKIEDLLAQNDLEEEDDEEFVNVNNSGLMLYKELYDKLYNYQRNGVAFLYSLYRDGRKGGILADDMGLGKTIQMISFLSGMYDNELAKHTLLIMPTSLITNWTKEFAKWTPSMRVKEFHGAGKERTRNLEKVQRRSGVIITTYAMLISNWQQLSSYCGKEFVWDYVVLDEAHKIKTTTTKTAKSAYAIPSKNRVLLTGTPVQNNLKEMWALFNFACQGTLLGTAKTFKAEYENPITRAREKDATPGEKALGSRMSENLMAIIKPYFLRRTKAEVQKDKMNGTQPCKEEHSDNKDSHVPNPPEDSGAVMPKLTRKNDLIVWTYLSSVQEDIYRQFLSLDHIKELLMTTRSPLAELNILKKLCDHPRLLSATAIAKLGLEESSPENEQNENTEADTGSIANVPDDTLISESGKLVFLFELLERLREEGHRTLVFAHFRKVLDIIERILGNRGFKVMRLDGTITQLAEREKRITKFQTDKSYSVFLLTTQVGGVGITLTAANRVVIYDPSWNPATDAQAVDRAYRIGQTENVVIYRLITCGTVEEKIYRRQVFKDSLIRQNTGDKKNPFRYFSKQELKELFTLEDTRSSTTQMQLQAMHSRHRRTDPELDQHIAHLHAMEMFGISDHDLMFSLDVNHDEDPGDQEAQHYIEGRVQKAQELMKAESELQLQLAESMASSTEPAWLRQPVDNNKSGQSNEKKPRDPRPSPSYPQHDFNRSPVVVDLDQSGSDQQDARQNLSDRVIDLTADNSVSEEQPVMEVSQDKLSEHNLDSPKHQSVKQERSYLEVANPSPREVIEESLVMSETSAAAACDMADASVQELMDESAVSEAVAALAGDHSLVYVTAVDEDEQLLTGTSHSKYDSKMDLGHQHVTPLQNKRLSALQASMSSFKADTSSRASTGLESFEGNFNLQLEDSDIFSDHDVLDQQTEEEEKKLLSQLQVEGSFDINKSLSERQQREALMQSLNNGHASEMDESNDSIVTFKKKRAALVYDSEEQDDDDDDDDDDRSQLDNSFQALGASTPKSAPSGPTPLRSRKSTGGNTSVASRRSFLQSIIDDMDNHNQDVSDESKEEDIIGSTQDELRLEESHYQDSADGEEDDISERHSDESKEEYIIGSTQEELQLEETVLYDSEEEEEEEEDEEEEDDDRSQLDNSFQVLGASTPKSAPSGSTPLRSRKSTGGNTSVASCRSLLQSIIDDMDNHNQDVSDESEEEDIIGSTHDELQLEETVGETLNTEGEEEEDEDDESGQGSSSNMEESASEPELASGERMDQCTVDEGVKMNGTEEVMEEESFDSLVSRGKEFCSKGKLDEALGFFLRAIDIKPGDPEIQLMTIQLYRQLSQRS